MKVLLLYLPVPHRGYREFLDRFADVDHIMLFDDNLIREFPHLRKNVPALSASEVRIAITAMGWNSSIPVNLATPRILQTLNDNRATVIMPAEDVCHEAAERYLPDCIVHFEVMHLRWDREATTAKVDVVPDCPISELDFDRTVMGLLEVEKEKSMDFWRQVAAAIVIDLRIIRLAYNRHVPDPELPYIFGDPRFNFSRGVAIELSTAEHAELHLIATCARDGIALRGASLYVTTFPCPPCAKAIASAGFVKCYFRNGYSQLDSAELLKDAGMEIIQVK